MIISRSAHNIAGAVILLLILRVSAEAVTLWRWADGWTTYIEEQVITSDIIEAPSTTIPGFSTPTTFTFTFEENVSGRRSSQSLTDAGAILYQSCGFGADGGGLCVDHKVLHGTKEITLTLSGSVVPFYTLVSSPSAAIPTRIGGGRSGSVAFIVILAVRALLYTM
ncbi:hypothetical protein MVEN_02266000 [Mycena venus]|uniref:Uncharacterized protein n=1 Tax=Mycena venus TaxID=2733690 RepID=A0A8H6X703_9AGAR|nr:hypothetical protein MVEN_02266000 [Mycena venus]